MQHVMPKACALFACALVCGMSANATDYYVSTSGSDDYDGLTAEKPFATVDKAVKTAAAADTIYVAAGTYTTTTKNAPEVKCALVGLGETRDDVVIQSGGTYRALKTTASTACISNVTIVGITANTTSIGGAVHMTGGTLVDCVIRDGKTTSHGGNVYVASGSVTIRDCEISGGSSTGGDGGNVYVASGAAVTIRGCVISDGTATSGQGGNVYLQGDGTVLEDSRIENGSIGNVKGKYGANVFLTGAVRLSRCRLIGGTHGYTTDPNAGSLIVNYSSSAVVEDCLIAESSCGGLVLPGGNTHLYNLTIANNVGSGVWSWNASQIFYNTVIYGNRKTDGSNRDWAGDKPGASGAFVNCAVGADSGFTAGNYPGLVLLSGSSDFVDYASGDYRPAEGGALTNAGANDPRRQDASETDLNGNPRTVNEIDIGCCEFQPTTFYSTFSSPRTSQDHAGETLTFTATPANVAEGATVSYSWDFGDGTDAVVTTEPSVSHVYAAAGIYTVTLTATSGESTFTQQCADYMIVYGTIYVNADATPQIPYATAETGLNTLPEALAVHSGKTGEVRILPGHYEVTSQQTITSAVTVRGMGETPDDVVVSNTATATSGSQYKRVFEVSHAGARVESLTMAGGRVYNQSGGNLRLVGGVVSNCVIRHGQITISGGNGGGGGVELAGSGILTHCWVTNNIVNGTAGDTWGAGGAVFLSYNSKGRMDNTLVAYNTYVPSTDCVRGSAGLQIGGNNDTAVIENCSIISNVVQGSVSGAAGVWSDSSWYTTLRNCVIAGNWQTASNAFSSATLTGYTKVYNCVMDVAPSRSSFYGDSTGVRVAAREAMFADFEGGDFTPKPGGRLANKGATPAFAADVDLAGNPRVFGKAIDVGCYEAQRSPGGIFIIR